MRGDALSRRATRPTCAVNVRFRAVSAHCRRRAGPTFCGVSTLRKHTLFPRRAEADGHFLARRDRGGSAVVAKSRIRLSRAQLWLMAGKGMVFFVVLERFGDAADNEKAAKGAPGRNDAAIGTWHKDSVEGIGGWGHRDRGPAGALFIPDRQLYREGHWILKSNVVCCGGCDAGGLARNIPAAIWPGRSDSPPVLIECRP